MNIYVVIGKDGHLELLNSCPRWDWEAMGQTVRMGNINGGDSVEIPMPSENKGR